jgi:AraC family transcriptional regulator
VVREDALVAFPGTSVVIQHLGGDPVLANRNHVMYYNRGQRYRRALHDGRGDHCALIALRPSLLSDLLGDAALPFAHGPSDPRAYLSHVLALHEVRKPKPDRLRVDELVYDALARSIERGASFNRVRRAARRARTQADRHELAEAAKELLTDRPTENLSLAEIARALHTSEFHLARVFQAHTGFSLHRYRTHLRLRLALDRLGRGQPLSQLAHELGFNSHSHFTDAFRAVFGAPPSEIRAGIGQLRKIVEAPLVARS